MFTHTGNLHVNKVCHVTCLVCWIRCFLSINGNEHFVLHFLCRGEAGDEASSHWLRGKKGAKFDFGPPAEKMGTTSWFFFLKWQFDPGRTFDALGRVLEVPDCLQVAGL